MDQVRDNVEQMEWIPNGWGVRVGKTVLKICKGNVILLDSSSIVLLACTTGSHRTNRPIRLLR